MPQERRGFLEPVELLGTVHPVTGGLFRRESDSGIRADARAPSRATCGRHGKSLQIILRHRLNGIGELCEGKVAGHAEQHIAMSRMRSGVAVALSGILTTRPSRTLAGRLRPPAALTRLGLKLSRLLR